MRTAALATGLAAICSAVVLAQSNQRETPGEMRRIVAEAICLGEGYPGTVVANDSLDVISVYQGVLGGHVTAEDLGAVRNLAKAARPADPTPVGNRNLAIARCVLFAGRPDVLQLLGERKRGK